MEFVAFTTKACAVVTNTGHGICGYREHDMFGIHTRHLRVVAVILMFTNTVFAVFKNTAFA